MNRNDDIPDDLKVLLGMDNTKQVIDLWYEITFLRLAVNAIINSNADLTKAMTIEMNDYCRKRAQEIVQDKFPLFKIEFKKIKESI